MLKRLFFKEFFFGIVLFNSAAQGSFYDQKPEGFLWYKEDPIPLENKAEKKTVTPPQALSIEEKAANRNQDLKAKLEGAIQVVLDEPTVENAITAQRMQKQVMTRSEEVSKVWKMAALVDAGLLDPQNNPNVLHRAIARQKNKQEDLAHLKEMSQEWGLFFSVMEDCVYCQKFAPIVKELQDQTGFQVLAVSQSGKDYGPFEGKKDTGFLDHLNPEGFAPMLYLVHKSGTRVYPVARGLTDGETLKANILLAKSFEDKGGIDPRDASQGRAP